MAASYRFVVSGNRVQGVGFRAATQRMAMQLGVRGWVRNQDGGAVEGAAAGSVGELAKFRVWLAKGPPSAQVSSVEWTPTSTISEGSFWVR